MTPRVALATPIDGAHQSRGDAISPSRPVLRWHGGKWRLAPWIISHFPPHRVYVEPFGGAASVLLRKPRAYADIYNDIDGDVVNLFRVLRDEAASTALVAALRLTPFARQEFVDAYVPTEDRVERARRMIVRSFMGFGTTAAFGRKTGFRANSNRSGTPPAADWMSYADALVLAVSRLRGVVIESTPAGTLIDRFDHPDTLFYVDPPYVHGTRSRGNPKHLYRHELSDDDHLVLIEQLRALSGMVVLSGYPSALYEEALRGWLKVERLALADGARERVEVLWINAAAAANRAHTLFCYKSREEQIE